MNNSNKKNKILYFFTLIFILIYAVQILGNKPVTLRIRATGEKEISSYGTDLRIEKILLNGFELTEKDVTLNGRWEVNGTSFAAVMADASTYIEIEYNKSDYLDIYFIRNWGSGYATIEIDGVIHGNYNLYDLDYHSENISIKGEQSSIGILPQVIYMLYGLVLLYNWVQLFLKKLHIEKYLVPNVPFMLFIAAVGLFFSVEYSNHNLANLNVVTMLENILLYFLMMAVLYIVTGKTACSAIVISVVWLLLSIANYYVTLFRGTMLTPTDFLVLETAKSVAGNYKFVLTKNICVAAAALVFFISAVIYLDRHTKNKAKRLKVAGWTVVGFVMLTRSLLQNTVYYWDINANLADYGFGVSMVSMAGNMYVAKPDNYDSTKAYEGLQNYAEANNDFSPNIIVVMNESFSDLSALNDNIDSNTYMPYYNSLQDNIVKGIAMVSTLGGGTSNSEWEFLTANSMMFIPNTSPYMQFVGEESGSVVETLNERGYYTAAIHPYYASGYNRSNVYQDFGFDDFIDIEDFQSKDYERNLYLSDRADYEKVIEVFESKEQESPVFIFNITMQNHSGYTSGYYGDDTIKLSPSMGTYPDAEEYLTLVKKSDEAIHILLDYFSAVEEPTVVLFFGDHQPYLDQTFYEEMFEISFNHLSFNNFVKMHKVPFFIWANYDIEEQQGVRTSLNFLSSLLFDATGIPTTAYQNYLLELYKNYPVISKTGYEDKTGEYYHYNNISSTPQQLQEYWYYQYYNMFG